MDTWYDNSKRGLRSGLIHLAAKILLCKTGKCPNQLKSMYEFYLNSTFLMIPITGDTDYKVLKFRILFVTCSVYCIIINRSHLMLQLFNIV